jgi:protein phosphatase
MAQTRVIAAGESSSGVKREKNEDSFALVKIPGASNLLAIVADGVGGHTKGEIASYICCRDLVIEFKHKNLYNQEDPQVIKDFLSKAIEKINSKIYERNYSDRAMRPMSTTLTAAVFMKEHIVLANAGDSRFYELTCDGKISCLTNDHLVTVKVIIKNADGELEKVQRQALSHAIGPRPEANPDIMIIPYNPKSKYMLCSDGIYKDLTNEMIIKCMEEAPTPKAAINTLMREAVLAGGRDNLSAVIIYPISSQG